MGRLDTLLTTPYVHFGIPGNGGYPWSGRFHPEDQEKIAITKLHIGFDGSYITRLQCSYDEKSDCGFKEKTQTVNYVIVFGSDEWITKFEVAGSGSVLNYIKVFTNKQSYGPYGVVGNSHAAQSVEPSTSGYGALWIEGGSSSNKYLTSLQVIWATYPIQHATPKLDPPSFLKFHNRGMPGSFRATLTPNVVLVVGTPPQRLTIPQGILKWIPVFSCYCEESQRLSPREIQIPEDDPEVMVALIEYLATGSYTYEHEHAEAVPPVNLHQTIFHLNLYATAARYQCPQVAKPALEAAIHALSQLGAVDTLKVLQQGYACRLSLEEMVPAGFGSLKRKIKELGESHGESLSKLALDCPALAGHLLALVAAELKI